MQKPIFFTHQNVKPSDLDFISTSYGNAIAENFTVFSKSSAGLVNGLQLSGTGGSSLFKVDPGVAYNNLGQRFEIYSPGSGVTITFTGTRTIYARLTQVNYDPNPATNPSGSANVVQSLNPDTNTGVNTRSYDFCYIDTTGTSSDVILGQVTANGLGQFISANSSGSQHLTLVNGSIDVYNGDITATVATGSVDSDSFVSGMNYNIIVNSGVNILSLGSGTSNLGSQSVPFNNIYANTGTFHQINGMSPIIMDSIQMKTGASVESTSGRLRLDSSGNGVQFGAGIITTGISAGIVSGNFAITTPSGNINIFSYNGSVNLSSPVNASSSLNVSGPATFTNGLVASGPIDLRNSTVLLPTSPSNQNNIIFNSDFSMGIPTYHSGGSIFNDTGATNFKSGLAILSPWDSRYSGTLTPYNWNSVGTDGTFRFLNGTSQDNTDAVGIDEVQSLGVALAPTSGNFYVVYTGIPAAVWPTGASVTGVTAQLPYSVTYTGLQAALEDLPNIGSGNVSVAGSFGTNFSITFVNGLGARNLPQMSISGSTLFNPTGTVSAAFSTTTQGYTPVFTALKDPTVFFGGPGLNHFARISGSNVSTNGSGIYFSTPVDGLKPSTEYNVSMYYKNNVSQINPSQTYFPLALYAAISDSPLSGTSFVDMGLTPTGSLWQRPSANIVTPDPAQSNNIQYLVFKLEPSGVTSSDVLANIAGVQLTEGDITYPYYHSLDGEVLSMIEPYGVTSGISGQPWVNAITSSANVSGVRSNAGISQATICSGLFFSPGGMCDINSNIILYGSTSAQMATALIVDNTVVNTQLGTLGTAGRSFALSKKMYLSRGTHSVTVRMLEASGQLLNATNLVSVATIANGSYLNLFGPASERAGANIMAPKIDIRIN